MRKLVGIAHHLWGRRLRSLLLGTCLSVAVLAAGIALLGLSGWFITAAGVAGLAGAGLTFDVFRPSAGVRFLALGRAAARYGERLATHDATLRVLADLRVDLLRSFMKRPIRDLMRMRGSERLQQFTADVDALDGLALRLMMPMAAAAIVLTLTCLLVWLLVSFETAAWIGGAFLVFSLIAASYVLRRARQPSRLVHRTLWALRMRLIDLLRGQVDLAVAGRLEQAREEVMEAGDRLQAAQSELDRLERHAAFMVGTGTLLAAGGALALGGLATVSGYLAPELAALAFFAALGIGELVTPITRGLAELGKMTDAAGRLAVSLEEAPLPAASAMLAKAASLAPPLSLQDVSIARGHDLLVDSLRLTVAAGETVAITGQSGVGKTTLLDVAAGLLAPAGGAVRLFGRVSSHIPESQRFATLGYLTQRSSLVSGTVAENLRLAAPEADDAALRHVVQAMCLESALEQRGGLSTRLGEGGRGLSGGETRRLALARLLLRNPQILLLDEVTEGLDRETAIQILQAIRRLLPNAAILMASHRIEEIDFADRVLDMAVPATEARKYV
jgi:ATP-binding cassette, subfamily C, bacterial CydC